MDTVRITVNGSAYESKVEPELLLIQYLRDVLGLTGTHAGCDTSQCGACIVLMDGLAVKSCTVFAVQADGSSVETVEGLASDGELSALQQAFWQEHGLQCGFCTPGMLMMTESLLRENPSPNESEIRSALSSVLCRCTGYHNIVKAVQRAACLRSAQSAAG